MESGKAKKFFFSSAKIAVAIVLAFVVLSLIGWGVTTAYQSYQQEKNADLAVPRNWQEKDAPALQVKFQLSSIWRTPSTSPHPASFEDFVGGRMQYRFTVLGYPDAISKARDDKENAAFVITFLDANGFKVFSESVGLRAMTRKVDAQGKGKDLHTQGEIYVGADVYRRAAGWQVGWRGFGAAKPSGD